MTTADKDQGQAWGVGVGQRLQGVPDMGYSRDIFRPATRSWPWNPEAIPLYPSRVSGASVKPMYPLSDFESAIPAWTVV